MPIRMLGVLLCYNDGDLLGESLEYLLDSGHDVVAWDHGSTDNTASVLEGYRRHLVEIRRIPRSVDFYGLYPAMSRHLLETFVRQYDWISWPDQDEFLEGFDRSRSYRDWVSTVLEMGYDWVRFINCNFWLTTADDQTEPRTVRRVRHYAPFLDCAPRLRAWRASSTNIRAFNHNPPLGRQWPLLFKLRHYPMRTPEQMERRLRVDRVGLRRGHWNHHYDNMANAMSSLVIAPDQLYYDDGWANLKTTRCFDWRSIYGFGGARDDEASVGRPSS